MTPLSLAGYVVGFILLCLAAPFVARWFCHAWGLQKPNFAGNVIPASTGLTFLFVGAIVYAILPFTGATLGTAYAPAFLLVCVGFGLLGLLDDKYGSRAVGGFKGHIGSLLRGKPTTGAVKLIGGGILALVAAFVVYQTNWSHLLVAAALIALGANTLNLFDTRPGRAQFSFFVLFTLPVLISAVLSVYALRYKEPSLLPDDVRFFTPAGVLLGPLVIAAAMEWWNDASGKSMMGDTGSNLLGATGGLAAAVTLSFPTQCGLLLLLVLINVVAEKVSFNAVIEKNRFLRAFDRALGVRAPVSPDQANQ